MVHYIIDHSLAEIAANEPHHFSVKVQTGVHTSVWAHKATL